MNSRKTNLKTSLNTKIHEKLPIELVGRQKELNAIVKIFQNDGDLLVTGAPGAGRHLLIKRAAQEVNAKLLLIDCIRARDGLTFTNLILRAIYKSLDPDNSNYITQILINSDNHKVFTSQRVDETWQASLSPKLSNDLLWIAFTSVIGALQNIANKIGERIIVILSQFSHIRSWDRKEHWEEFLRAKICNDPEVSYVILGTVADEHIKLQENSKGSFELVELKPLNRDVITAWARETLDTYDLTFNMRNDEALNSFVNAAQGHIGEARTLLKRLVLECQPGTIIEQTNVMKALSNLLEDFSTVFESLLMLLPYSQIQLLECLAVEPTTKPHKKEYLLRYGLSRGGSLQAALRGLQQKGLIYGSECEHQLTIPLFAYWIKRNKLEFL